MNRRRFVQFAAAGCASCIGGSPLMAFGASPKGTKIISPGCRKSKVKVALLYVGVPGGLYPNPNIKIQDEMKVYAAQFAKLQDQLRDVDFTVDILVSNVDQVKLLKDRLKGVDGILAIHLTLGTGPVFREILSVGRPTVVFSPPYAGHEWHALTAVRRQKGGENLECLLTTNYKQLAVAIRPFRAIHHLREAKVLNVAARQGAAYVKAVKDKFGTEIKQVPLEHMVAAYNAVDDRAAKDEAKRWTKGARKIVEPTSEEIFKSCKMALAFEALMDEEEATVIAVDCYGTMYQPLCHAYAYPCIGFTRLNDMGLGGICQSDLPCVMTYIIFQGLSGRPGFTCNPTFDFSTNSATLIHCLGTRKMDGPDGPAARYNLRSVMERQEGVTPQVRMRIGQEVTTGILDQMSPLLYFTGKITATPETERGCRTKIAVKVDGSSQKLWRNWGSGIHRLTCYGDLRQELELFCRFKQIEMINEA
ncbi:twin-arginine translocation signal domain-containing protein [Candidatus Sumerlaeota bacterium]|nr:twin-arginine translocation signal domain-containing protein [Candidatus Sumerlaeota bacterium]